MNKEREKLYKEKVKQLIEFAGKNGNSISYTTVADIMKDRDDLIKDSELGDALCELDMNGIEVTPITTDEGYSSEEESANTFLPADVKVSQIPVTVYGLMERLRYHEIELQPNFQRKDFLWTEKQQSQLIESLILKIPLPAFYFDASEDDRWIVIDGLQRLSAFKNYLVGDEVNNWEKKKFQGFEYLKDLNGFSFDELPRQYMRRIQEATIIVYTVEKGTPKEVVYNIFRRINTGGLQLKEQEIRNALYQGKATELTEKLAGSEEFLDATQNAVKPERMLDREYILRYLAFTELNFKDDYKGNIDDYLIKGLKHVDTYSEAELETVSENFKRVMSYCSKIFGRYAFRKYNQQWRRGPINKAIFELWSICFCKRTDDEMNRLCKKKDDLLKEFQGLLMNDSFVTALRAGDRYSVTRRVEMTEKMLEDILCLTE